MFKLKGCQEQGLMTGCSNVYPAKSLPLYIHILLSLSKYKILTILGP
jgi:hypothetical protein